MHKVDRAPPASMVAHPLFPAPRAHARWQSGHFLRWRGQGLKRLQPPRRQAKLACFRCRRRCVREGVGPQALQAARGGGSLTSRHGSFSNGGSGQWCRSRARVDSVRSSGAHGDRLFAAMRCELASGFDARHVQTSGLMLRAGAEGLFLQRPLGGPRHALRPQPALPWTAPAATPRAAHATPSLPPPLWLVPSSCHAEPAVVDEALKPQCPMPVLRTELAEKTPAQQLFSPHLPMRQGRQIPAHGVFGSCHVVGLITIGTELQAHRRS
mmetsp:Transcript_62534/g.201694  ORF Transcript_62534/g.201694 Transcript_62534/m.201694 type:complete len:268 (-) Transcript_62534:497-1300(-)